MKNNISIHIPKPCHENWEQMTPVDKGRFCQSCAKQVVDFSVMTDQEVLNYFSKATDETCGRFASKQLNRPLQPVTEQKKKAWWIVTMMPLLLLFKKADAQKKDSTENVIKLEEYITTGLADVIVVQSGGATDYWPVPTDDNRQSTIISTPEIRKPKFNTELIVKRRKGDTDFVVSGKIIDSHNNEPLSFATVAIKGTKTAAVTNATGHFTLAGKTTANQAVLTVNYIGFSDAEVLVNIRDTQAVVENIYNISGYVVDEKTKQPISYSIIVEKGGRVGVASGADGKFSIKFQSSRLNPAIIVSSVGYHDKEIGISANYSTNEIMLDTIYLSENEARLQDVVVVAGSAVCYKKPAKKDTIPTLIRKVFRTDKFKMYPNPVQRGENINIVIKNAGNYSIQLFDNNGNLIIVKEFEATQNVIQTTLSIPSTLTAGTYYIRLVDDKKKKQYTDKIIIM